MCEKIYGLKSILVTLFIFLAMCDCVKKFVPNSLQDSSLQVNTSDGIIQGFSKKTDSAFTYFSFLGIPFAQPPIGDLRFRAPHPPEKWDGVLDGRISGNCCAGLNLLEINFLNFQPDGYEDCLYLNVFTPSIQPSNEPLKPVMVFFYGGGFLAGCADKSLYGPEFLVVHDVVLVTVNYRLSLFGGLSTEDDECPGNWNLKDQIASLKWIQANIKNFRGDPKRVTIFGQSAGAASVNYLMLSPQTKGLFHGAIMESGSVLNSWANWKTSRQTAFNTGIAGGIITNSSKELVEKLRRLNSDELKDLQVKVVVVAFLQMVNDGLPFGPVLENPSPSAAITENSFTAMEKGHYHRVPVMMGITSLEFMYFYRVAELIISLKALLDVSPSLLSRNIKLPLNRYRAGKKIRSYFIKKGIYADATSRELYELLSSDLYIRPLSKAAALLAQHNRVYFYQFSFMGLVGEKTLEYLVGISGRPEQGVGHAEDIVYLFNTNMTPPITKLPLKDQKTVIRMTKLWTNFAKFGNPTPKSDPDLDGVIWPSVLTNEKPFIKNYLEIGDKLIPHFKNFEERDILFWDELYKKYRKRPYVGGY